MIIISRWRCRPELPRLFSSQTKGDSMQQVQKGFTLIELMIMVATIGILAAVATPAYQDYIARAQASEGVGLTSGGKTPLSEYYADKGFWPALASDVMGTTAGKYVSKITDRKSDV